MDTVNDEGTRMSAFGSRLREERSRMGMSQPDFAALAGVKKNAQIQYEAGKRAPDTAYLLALVAHGADAAYLLSGARSQSIADLQLHGAAREVEARRQVQEALRGVGRPMPIPSGEPEFVAVPLHDAALAAGVGAVNDEEAIIGALAFRRDWLRSLGIAPSAARLARAEGQSMEPTICDRDLVLIDTTATRLPEAPRQRGDNRRRPIFTLLDEGTARIKRVDRLDADHLLLLSDNPDFQPEVRPVSAIQPIGRIRWSGHTVKE